MGMANQLKRTESTHPPCADAGGRKRQKGEEIDFFECDICFIINEAGTINVFPKSELKEDKSSTYDFVYPRQKMAILWCAGKANNIVCYFCRVLCPKKMVMTRFRQRKTMTKATSCVAFRWNSRRSSTPLK